MNTCYTVITNNYDELKDPRIVSDDWQYVVFSDRHLESDVWDCIITEKHNRDIKIRPYLEMFENLTLYVDASIEIVGDLNQFASSIETWWTMWKHPHRTTVEQEIDAVINLKSINRAKAKKQYARYKKEGFNDDLGLAACGVILRDLSDNVVKEMCDDWWREFERGVRRDQISIPYIFWKHGYEMDLFDNELFNKYFNWLKHAR